MFVITVFQLAKPFLANLQIFHIFRNPFWKQCKNSGLFWYPHSNFYKKKISRSYLHFFETSKSNSQETAQNVEKHVYKRVRIALYTNIPVNPYHFLNKSRNHCTLFHRPGLRREAPAGRASCGTRPGVPCCRAWPASAATSGQRFEPRPSTSCNAPC